MAMDKNSNSYTFLFAITVIVVVGASLAAVAIGLKPLQQANDEIKKKMEILGALNIECTRDNAVEMFNKYIDTTASIVLNSEGQEIPGDPFSVDHKKEYKDKTLDPKDRQYPLIVANIDGETRYVIPMVGSGLWGPIWGNIAIKADMSSISGAKFNHKGETPGLGAEIVQKFYYSQYESESISENGVYTKIKSVKDGSGNEPHKIDGITGGTITSKGVEEMVDRTLQVYVKYFATKTN
jgi:Na+-transporting NADH:ubiquinone oxidoreductase subunit C